MVQLIKRLSEEGNIKIIEAIKLLLYKNNENIFETLDFENDLIYKEPFLYTYFNFDDYTNIESILFTYWGKDKLKITTDKYGRFYLPQKGWFTTDFVEKELLVTKPNYDVFFENEKIDCIFENILNVKDTKVEILQYPLSFLEPLFTNADLQIVPVEIINITKLQRDNLKGAYQIIKQNNPDFFELIEKFAFKCVIFNTDFMNRNSFAHKYAHGIAFYNSYQEDYDEIFFVDDISHQCAHIILTTILFNNDNFFKIDKETSIQKILISKNIDVIENRTLEVVYHALFTYYFILDNLDKVNTNMILNHKQKHEILGRISIYIHKCQNDLFLLEHLFDNFELVYFSDAMIIYTEIKNKLLEMKEKYTSDYNFEDHPYNFTYKHFIEKNPI